MCVSVRVRVRACPCSPVCTSPPLSPLQKKSSSFISEINFIHLKKKNLSLENGCCLIKLSFHGYCWVLLGFTMGLPGFTEFYLVVFFSWMDATLFYWSLPSFTEFYWVLQSQRRRELLKDVVPPEARVTEFLTEFFFRFLRSTFFPSFQAGSPFFYVYRVLPSFTGFVFFLAWHRMGRKRYSKDTRDSPHSNFDKQNVHLSTNRERYWKRYSRDHCNIGQKRFLFEKKKQRKEKKKRTRIAKMEQKKRRTESNRTKNKKDTGKILSWRYQNQSERERRRWTQGRSG